VLSADAQAAVVASEGPSPIRRTFRSNVFGVAAKASVPEEAASDPASIAMEIATATLGRRKEVRVFMASPLWGVCFTDDLLGRARVAPGKRRFGYRGDG
jgi:hypothetical protein